MTYKRWMAFDVGCIECGEESAVIGLFSTQQEAEAAAGAARERQSAKWHGQHSMEVFDLEAVDKYSEFSRDT